MTIARRGTLVVLTARFPILGRNPAQSAKAV